MVMRNEEEKGVREDKDRERMCESSGCKIESCWRERE